MNTHPAIPDKTFSTIRKLIVLLTVALLPLVAKAQPAVTITTGPTTCGGTNGLIRVSNLLVNQPYIVYYNKNGVGLPGAFILSTDASGNLDIVTWGTFTVTAGSYSDIQVSDGVVTNFFPGPYVLTDPAPPTVAVSSHTFCGGGTTPAINFTGTGNVYNWTNNNTSIGLGASGSGNIAPFTTTNATTIPATATITVTPFNSATLCSGTPANFTITVNPAPTVNTVSNQAVCNGSPTAAISFSGALSGTSYDWTNDNPTIGLAASGTGDIASFTATNSGTAPATATITVTPVKAGCPGTPTSFTITVNPTPTVDAVSNQTLCHMATTTAVNFTGAVSGATYNWTNSNNFISLAPMGTGNINPFTITNTASSPVTATITVTPTKSGCTGTPGSFSFTVNPQPITNTSSIPDQTLCNGGTTTAVNFTGYVPGTTYHWTNDNITTGLAASGTGDIAAFTATNSGATASVATITVTPTKSGCTGTAKTFTITVNPIPTVNTVSNQTVCANASTSAIAFTGAVSGTTYNWANDNTSIGLAASGTGDIVSFTASNTGTIPTVATITVTPVKNGCPGTARSFTITVNPMPTVDPVADQTVCNGSSTAVVFGGAVTGTSYNWINNNTSIGLTGSGSGDIATFTAVNSGTTPVTATIIVTPVKGLCTGAAETFTIAVDPTPTVNTVSNQTICNNGTTTAVNFTGAVTGTSYSWTNNTTSIGLAAGGTGNIAAFTATNTSTAPVIATITVTPTANGCAGTPRNFTITVNPTPATNAVADQALCNGATTTAVNFSSAVSGTSYSWVNNTTSIGLAASGTGNIATFTALNTGNTPVTAVINVTPSANGCTGAPRSFNIDVNPTPTLINPGGHYACNGAPINVNLAGPVAGTSFAWVNNNTSIGLAANGTGSIASFTTINNGTAPEIATVDVTPSANGCTGPVASFTITVKPIPALTSTLTPADICDNTVFHYTPTSATSGTTFAWNRQAVTGISNPASMGNNDPAETLNNTMPGSIVVMYRYFLYADGCGNSEYVAVVVNPTPRLNNILPDTLCSGEEFNFTPTTLTAGSNFAWSRASMAGITPAGTTGTGDIKESLFNSTSNTINVPYVYTLTANGCTGTDIVTLTLHARPQAPVISVKAPEAVCTNTMYQNFGAATAAPAGAFYTWTANNAVVWSQGDGNQNALVNFPNAGASTVTLTTTLSATGCDTSTTVTVQTGSSKAQQPEVIYYNSRFVCLQNDMDVYIWGYDDKGSLDSTVVPNEKNQDYLNFNPDFNNRLYWVMTMKNGCAQKSYYNAPTSVEKPVAIRTEMRVYPNPATETVNFEMGAAYGAEVSFSVYDVAGKLIQTVPATTGKAKADVSALAPGMYSVICTADGVKVAVTKFVKH